MKTLILGADGQVGRALQRLEFAGRDLVGLDIADCDITDADAIARTLERHQPSHLINVAAYTAVDRAESEPDAAFLVNAHAPGLIAQACRTNGVSLIHISTDFVFDGASGRPYAPSDKPAPLNVYGTSKLAGEEKVLESDSSALVIRTAWVYGPVGGNFVSTMLRLMRERGAVRVVSDQVGTPTFAPSLAGAIWALADDQAQGIHHYTDAGVASWYDFAVAIAEEAVACGLLSSAPVVEPIPGAAFPTPAKRPACAVLDKAQTWALLASPPPHWRVHLRQNLRELAHG